MIPTIVAAQGFIVPLGGSGCNVPEDNAGFVSVSSSEGPGEEFYLALRANGTIVAWGENTWGQCDVHLATRISSQSQRVVLTVSA